MMCLTVKNPWAALIAISTKRIENRTWPTNFRGALAIHAAKYPDPHAANELLESGIELPDEKELVYQAVIAVCELVDCVEIENLPDELADDQFACGPWCWILSNVQRIEPVKIGGKLGLWQFDEALLKGRVA